MPLDRFRHRVRRRFGLWPLLRRAFLLAALALSNGAWAASPLYMVELAVFTCQHCKAVNDFSRQIDIEVGEFYIFAPIGTGGLNATELAWYAMRKDPAAPKLRAALFSLQQDMRVAAPSVDEVVDWVSLYAPSISMDQLERGMGSQEAQAALKRAEGLVATSGVASVPAFVFIRDGKVAGTLEKGARDAPSFVAEGLKMYRQLKGDTK